MDGVALSQYVDSPALALGNVWGGRPGEASWTTYSAGGAKSRNTRRRRGCLLDRFALFDIS